MTANTYVALDKTTVTGSSVASVTLNMGSTITQSYTDLVLIVSGSTATAANMYLRFNGDTGNNYSAFYVSSSGTTYEVGRNSSTNAAYVGAFYGVASFTANIMNYSNTTKYKSILCRTGDATQFTRTFIDMWSSNSAITSITVFGAEGNLNVGTTVSLYGIRAEGISPTTKATGGAVYSDSTYYYHVFGASGTFTPTQSITADLLVIAGGGGSGYDWSGSGGAGGVQFLSGQSLTATSYSVTVGAGGASATAQGVQGSNGGNSTFGSTIVNAIGGGGAHCFSAGNANSGGSGGGGGTKSGTSLGGAAVAGTGGIHYGNAGGNGTYSTGVGGGGGAGGAGETNTGIGGPGTTLFSSWGTATGTGTNVSNTYYYAAGGQGVGGAAYAARGAANTGNGAGSDNLNGGGGSGIVIVRYAK